MRRARMRTAIRVKKNGAILLVNSLNKLHPFDIADVRFIGRWKMKIFVSELFVTVNMDIGSWLYDALPKCAGDDPTLYWFPGCWRAERDARRKRGGSDAVRRIKRATILCGYWPSRLYPSERHRSHWPGHWASYASPALARYSLRTPLFFRRALIPDSVAYDESKIDSGRFCSWSRKKIYLIYVNLRHWNTRFSSTTNKNITWTNPLVYLAS